MPKDNTQTDTVKESLFKSLKLTVLQTPEGSSPDKEPELNGSGEPVPEVAPEVPTITDDTSLLGTLTAIREEAKAPKKEPTEKEPEPEEYEKKETEPEKKEEPEVPAEPKIEVKKKKVEVKAPEIETPKLPEPEKKPEPAALPEDLTDEEREEIEIARFAAEYNPTKYSGLESKVTGFIKKHNEYLDAKMAADPDFVADPSENSEYKRWLETNKPDISRSERRDLEKKFLIHQAKKEASEEAEAKIREVNDRIREIETRPKIAKAVTEFSEAVTSLMPEDIAEAVRAGTLEEDLPMEAPTVRMYLDLSTKAANEFLNLTNGVTKYDQSNQVHTWLGQFIHEQSTIFLKGGKNLEKDGKSFLPRGEFNALPASKQKQHWTFTDTDILNMLAYQAQATVVTAVKAEREKLDKILAARNKKTPGQKQVSTPSGVDDEEVSPRAATSAVPSPGSSPAKPARDPLMAAILRAPKK